MVCTQQFLAWLMEQIDDSDNAKIVRIEKGFINSATIDGINQVLEPTTVYTVLDRNKTFMKTVVYKDIREAAREAERLLDFDVLEVAYKENPDSFKSEFKPENSVTSLNNGLKQTEGEGEKK